MTTLKGIQNTFENALSGQDYFAELNQNLQDQYRFSPENTRFAEGGCCDEINEAEYLFLENFWGERFKFGGLAGYCHAGRTGMGAVSHHVPEQNGEKNLLLVCGPHIGFHDGQWGQVPRTGQTEITTSCGSLIAALSAADQLANKATDPLDQQQRFIETIVMDYLKTVDTPEVVSATQFLAQRVSNDMQTIVGDLKPSFDGNIALVVGITINTGSGNFFAETTHKVFQK